MDLINHFYHDHTFFAGRGGPNLQFLIYLAEEVQEIGTGRSILQKCFIDTSRRQA